MSLARLVVSGLLIAGGLILGTFTLHGYFDPQWTQKQAHAAGRREPPGGPKAINTFQGRSRFVSQRAEPPAAGARPPNAAAAPGGIVKAADARPARPLVKKKVVEKPKPPPQQAAVQWPWNLFSSN
ncbi:MAG: hypothetical protein K2X43_02215 [Hyphomonadaceae bacterium]|nr:hypothetical protein [Hyphomonadaceae bacterium]